VGFAETKSLIDAPYQNRRDEGRVNVAGIGSSTSPTLSRRSPSDEKRLGIRRKPGQVITPVVGKEFYFTLDGFDIGQILDGLRCRQESWANTAIFLRDDYFPDDSFLCEECSDADEAQKIADHYSRIISAIEQQIEQQGGW